MDVPREHSAHSSKILFKVVIGMFFLIQMLAGVVIKNFYDRFTDLEQENVKYDQQIDELKTEIKVLDALISIKRVK